MSAKSPLPARPLPLWLVIAATVFVAFHLFAVVILVLSATSGPWLSPFGPSPSPGPEFAGRIAAVTTQYYLQPLQMTHNYHFPGNRPDASGIYFEVRLKDAQGREIDLVRYPSSSDSFWLRQRHNQLAQQLGNDEPIEAQRTEQIAGPGKKAPTVKIWESQGGPTKVVLREVPSHLVPKNQPVSRPREWSLILVRSYLRHLCREKGATSAELTRFSRQPVMPFLLLMEEAPPGTYDTLVSTYEGYRREN
jgi:hypothetical protein